MGSALPDREEVAEVLAFASDAVAAYLAGVDERATSAPFAARAVAEMGGPLPDTGGGAVAALRALVEQGLPATLATAGPRNFHFVMGGATPAALGADVITSGLDQMAYAWASSPLGAGLERVALGWLKELFDLPASWGGVITTGATMANATVLAAARQWWGEQQGVDVAEDGLAGLAPFPVLSSGYLHPSTLKGLALLGVGRRAVQTFEADAVGRADVEALREAAADAEGPVVIAATLGEPNAGDSDPVAELADIAHDHDAWLHVDGAFGLFARVTPRAALVAEGVDRAQSVVTDGHKWLNVPYDCGFAFVEDARYLVKTFAFDAAYLPDPHDAKPVPGAWGPESSRRARALPVWATLKAYGRSGVRHVVERHLSLAQELAALVDDAADLERLAPVPLNVVVFRFNPGGLNDIELDSLNERIATAVTAGGRVLVGSTRYDGRVAFRPALANWRIRSVDVRELVNAVQETGHKLSG